MFVGIDFGTTFSQAATIYCDQPTLLLPPGEYGIPSEFYYDSDSGVLVGQDALDAGQGNYAKNLKNEVKMDLKNSFSADGRTFSPKEMVCAIYRNVVTRALDIGRKRNISSEIEGMVISVPAKFGLQERSLICSAAKECLPGKQLVVADIIKEPVAAALSYFKTEAENEKCILVYDLGGGTCDIALVRADDSLLEHYDVIDSDMVRLGGRDWDKILTEYIWNHVEHKLGQRISGNPGYTEKFRRAAISVKHQLSDPLKERATARVEIGGQIVSIPVTQKVFEEITAKLLSKTLQCLKDVYDRNISTCTIEEIICVGGSSNMPQVEAGIRNMFPRCNVHIFEPEHAVIYGNAIYAEMLRSHSGGFRDIASFSYGIETIEDYDKDPDHYIVANIILRGAKLPAEDAHTFTPVADNQKAVRFPIYESEYPDASYERSAPDIRHVGDVVLDLFPQTPKTEVLTCQMKLTGQGLLGVTAHDSRGNRVNAEFHMAGL